MKAGQKPLHHELIEQGARSAPEAESVDELFKRLVRPSRAIEVAGGLVVAIGLVLKALGALAFLAGGLLSAIGFAALIGGIAWDVIFGRKRRDRPKGELRLRDLFRRTREEIRGD